MSLRISFDLDDDDLQHFRLIMRTARSNAARRSPEEIVAAATELLQTQGNVKPGFVLERLHKLEMMMRMISDLDWRLPHTEVSRVLNALAYFAEPDDLIPDDIPGLGFLDDAIMVELVVRELRHEIEAYEDFCEFRDSEQQPSAKPGNASSRDRLQARRRDLQARMRRRRERDQQRSGRTGARLLD